MLDGNVDAWEDYCKLQKEVESIVNRVAKREVGEKMIVCGKSAR